jgi:sugar lactone lactonase YvrE
MKRNPTLIRRSAASTVLALCIGAAVQTNAQDVEVIASGLNNPRGLGFAANGALYVTEMGNGGSGACIPSPAAPVSRCYGETGALTLIDPHSDSGHRRIITGLPSLGLPNGNAEGGPADVSFHGMVAFVTMAFGGDPALRSTFGKPGSLFGSLLKAWPAECDQFERLADVSGHEVRFNPYGGPIDSNPYGLLALPGRRIIADAGANALIEVRANRRTKTLATLAPASGGRDPVPTAVAEGPDGAIYVSQLTGFPFFRGTSTILRVESDGSSITPHASGFTAAVDIAVDHGGALYVLEVASGQVPPFPPPAPGLGIGRLVRQCPGGAQEVLLGNLTFPGGVALGPDDAVYLTNNGTSPTAGQVLRVTVDACH